MDAAKGTPVPAWFVNKDSGHIVHVTGVDGSFARMQFDYGDGTARSFDMPIAQYDTDFVAIYRPATAADLSRETNPDFRLPLNAPEDWKVRP